MRWPKLFKRDIWKWHAWYAWHPVYLYDHECWAWLETVERCGECSWTEFYWCYRPLSAPAAGGE